MKNRLTLLLTLAITSVAAMSALPTSYYAPQSRLASGHWVKVSTTAEGIYQLTYDQLRDMGFSDPERVQVYGYHATTVYTDPKSTSHIKTSEHALAKNQFAEQFPDDLQPVATRHTADGRILFYGEGDHTVTSAYARGAISTVAVARNYYDTASHYFLSDCDGATDIPVRPQGKPSPQIAPFDTHIHIESIEEELQAPNNGGTAYLGRSHAMGSDVPYTFSIRNYHAGAKTADASFLYSYAIRSASDTRLGATLPSSLRASAASGNINSAASGISETHTTYSEASGYLPFTAPEGLDNVPDGDYTFTVNIPSGSATFCAADFVALRYPRLNKVDATDPFVVMNLQEAANYTGYSILFPDTEDGEIELWNIDLPAGPQAYTPDYDPEARTTTFTLDTKTWRTVAFNPALTFPAPTVDGPVANQNIHGLDTPDMVIITTAAYAPYAERLAALHRDIQGMDVHVLVHTDIYNEFSSGTRDAMAYRRMAKMFYDRDPGKLRYLLLFGPGYFDNRCLISPAADRLVCYEQDVASLTRNVITNYTADMYFSFLDDTYKHDEMHYANACIAVGRISSITESQASNYVNKVEKFMTNPARPSSWNNAILIGGSGDYYQHVMHSYEVYLAMASHNPNLNFIGVPYDLYPSAGISKPVSEALIAGAGYMTFSGHGSPTTVNGWGIQQNNNYDYDNPPFVMFSSCDQFAFDRMRNGLTESMLFKENGGAIAGVASSREVYIVHNQLACLNVARAYAEARPGSNYGDLMLRARELALDSLERCKDLGNQNPFGVPQTAFRNLLAYSFAGDPAIPVNAPQRTVAATVPASTSPFKATPVSGRVTLENGQTDTEFDGTVYITVYDGFTSKSYTYQNIDFEYPVHDKVLTRVEAPVKGGEFSTSMMLPVPSTAADSYRITFSASSDAGTNAYGLASAMSVGDINPDDLEAAGTEAPSILSFDLTDSSIGANGLAISTPSVHAVIYPSATGLRFQTSDINTRTRLIVDGTTTLSGLDGLLHANEDGNYELEAPVGSLSDGQHTVELIVGNNLGLTARSTLSFTSRTTAIEPILSTDRHVVADYAEINCDATADYSRLVIADPDGNTVHSVENPAFPYRWNLTDADGKPVADGRYKATLMVRRSHDYGHSAPIHIVVLR